jgi:hypothetical protein
MKINKSSLSALALLALLLNFCSKKDPSPATSISIDPTSGSVGTTVTISGSGFSATASDNIVKFNGKVADVMLASTTQIAAVVPFGATTGAVTVTVSTKTFTGPTFTVTEPKVTQTYYLKFKANGVVKVYQSGNPGFQTCGNCACSIMPPAVFDNASLDVCKADNDDVVAANIIGWNSKTIPFKNSGTYPVASFYYTENGVGYSTDNVADQTNMSVNVTNVVSDGTFYSAQSFKVTGTFQCKVAKSDGTGATAITEGSFVVKYTEYY